MHLYLAYVLTLIYKIYKFHYKAGKVMRQYTGIKVVDAAPMTRGDYNALRGWKTPADESPEDAGYLVEYVGQGNPNHANYENYTSWSPKDVFESSYTLSGTPLERLHLEETELEKKIYSLSKFMKTDHFYALEGQAQTLLRMQLEVMRTYSSILGLRIVNFK